MTHQVTISPLLLMGPLLLMRLIVPGRGLLNALRITAKLDFLVTPLLLFLFLILFLIPKTPFNSPPLKCRVIISLLLLMPLPFLLPIPLFLRPLFLFPPSFLTTFVVFLFILLVPVLSTAVSLSPTRLMILSRTMTLFVSRKLILLVMSVLPFLLYMNV